MRLTSNHFLSPSEHHIHLISQNSEMERLEARVRKIAMQLAFHFAYLDGSLIYDQTSMAQALAEAYEFPSDIWPDPQYPNWDSINEWMGDLTWIAGLPRDTSKVRGFLLLYEDPSTLFLSSPTDLVIFISIISNAAYEFAQAAIPFHLILGPLHDKAQILLQLLKTADNICTSDHLAVS